MLMHECEDSSQLIDDIYDAALDAGHWPHVLERLACFFGSSSVHLAVDNHAATQGRMISFGTDPAYAQSYASYYGSRNVLWQRLVQRALDGVLTNHMIMPDEELHKSEFYNDFLRPHDDEELLCSIGPQQTDPTTSFIIFRPERAGPWQPEHVKALARLTPHLRRAIDVNQRIGDLSLAHALATEALYELEHGAILVDAQASILFANRTAEAMLANGDLRLDRKKLAAKRASDTTVLRRLINGAAQDKTGGTLVLSRDARPSLLIIVLPIKTEALHIARETRGAILFIKDLERVAKPPVTAFADYFGLTPAQAALAHELAAGDGLTAAAKRLGVSHNTVRTHINQIFQKTATRRQAELVRLIFEWTDGPTTPENLPGKAASRRKSAASVESR